MSKPPTPFWHRSSGRIFVSVALVLLLAASASAADVPATGPGPGEPPPLHLSECLRYALNHQPAVAAARANVAVAEAKLHALEQLHMPAVLTNRDLPLRLKQARLGLASPQAAWAQAEQETVYAVTRLYFAVLYARAQRRVTDDLVGELRFLQEQVEATLKRKARTDWSEITSDLITLYLSAAEARQAEAARGVELATAALAEAMGMESGVCLRIAEESLPEPEVPVCREQIQALALARRGELVEANTVSGVTFLEAEAQARVCRPAAVRTFAAGADLHFEPVAPGVHDGEYRPGALAVAMPTFLAGSRPGRVEVARALGERAEAVAEKTRNLIALEAEDAFLKWREAEQKVALRRKAAQAGARLEKRLRSDVSGGGPKVVLEFILVQSVLIAQAQANYQEALYQKLIALADLERVTAGGFCAGLAGSEATGR